MQNWPSWLPIRQDLVNSKPYGAPQIDVSIRLNTNENPYPVPLAVKARIENKISSAIGSLNRYPDRDAVQLRRALASYVNSKVLPGSTFEGKNIWPANGSNEVLQSIFLAFGGASAGFQPSYSMHSLIAKTLSESFAQIALTESFDVDLNLTLEFIRRERPKLFFITTPNNPTGKSVSFNVIETLLSAQAEHGGLLIVDEAYGEFSSQISAASLLASSPSLIVVRTMSKAFAFAGTRLGYAIARSEVIDALTLVRLPYHLGTLTQATALAALEEYEELLADVERIKESRDHVAAELSKLGLEVIESDANFLFFGGFGQNRFARPLSSDLLWQALLNRGVLIRDVGIDGYLRVTIGREEENQVFLAALREILTQDLQ